MSFIILLLLGFEYIENLTFKLGKSLKAEPIIDNIVFPVEGPRLGLTEYIFRGQKQTTESVLQNIYP